MKIRDNSLQYVLIFLLIATSGFPFFSHTFWFLVLFAFSLIIAIMQGIKITKKFVFYILLLSIILIIQSLLLNYYNIITIFGLYIRVFSAFFVVSLLDKTFFLKGIRVLYYLTLISFIIFPIINLFPGSVDFLLRFGISLPSTLLKEKEFPSIIIYNLNPHYINQFRNNGPFWEPGAFGGYLNIFLAINVFFYDKKLRSKENIVFIIGIITTFSTTAYILLSFIFIAYFLIWKKFRIFGLIFLFVTIIAIYMAFFQLDFMRDKIYNQFEVAKYGQQANIEKGGETRFTSMVYDMDIFVKSPIFGGGIYDEVRLQSFRRYSNNGITDFLAKLGILFFWIYFFSMYKGFMRLKKRRRNSIFIVVLIIIAGFSETYFISPFFFSLSLSGVLGCSDVYNVLAP